MRPRFRTLLLTLGLMCLLFGLGVEAAAQGGRLRGRVVFYNGAAAAGVRVIAKGYYEQTETRTDDYGNFVLVLRPGGYNIFVGAPARFRQATQVVGYVRGNADSYTEPNPIVLVSVSSNSNGPTSLALSQTAWGERSTAAQHNSFTQVVAVTGRLRGKVVLRKTKIEPAKNVSVTASGAYEQGQTRTDKHGDFVLELRAGRYMISIQADGFQPATAVGEVTAGKDNSAAPNPIVLTPVAPEPPRPEPMASGGATNLHEHSVEAVRFAWLRASSPLRLSRVRRT